MVGGDERPETRFASFGEDKIAYQVFGEGDVDLIYTPAAGDPIDLRWDWPSYAGSFAGSAGELAWSCSILVEQARQTLLSVKRFRRGNVGPRMLVQ